MALNRIMIINRLIRHLIAKSYLEIGVQQGECFRRVLCADKTGVDPDKTSAATIHLPSDRFFALFPQLELPAFDVVFVDGLHHRDQVFRDIMNARKVMAPGGAIVVHDCDPPTQQAGTREMCNGVWCGDVWQGWLDTRMALAKEFGALGPWTGTVDADLGCGLVIPWMRPEPIPENLPEGDRAWGEFQTNRKLWLNLITPQGFLDTVAPTTL